MASSNSGSMNSSASVGNSASGSGSNLHQQSAKIMLEKNVIWGAGHGLFVLFGLLSIVTPIAFFYKAALSALCLALIVEVYHICLAVPTHVIISHFHDVRVRLHWAIN